jgi:hypothetical protein
VTGKEEISAAFRGRNYGVGCPGGVEVVAHSLRDTLETHKSSKLGLLKIDFRNAFNEVKRDHFVKAVRDIFPGMSTWTQWCYGEATMLLYDHQHVIWSRAGVQQGDPLGPLYFCCGINALVNEIDALNPVYNKWYMDDGGIVGDVELLKRVWEILKTRGPALGLHLNPSKCEWSWLDPECTLAYPIRLDGVGEENQVKLVPHSEIQMLGVPLGDTDFVSEFVEKKLLGRLQETVAKLVEFEDSQAATYLLRVSYSTVRAVHFMRTTPLSQWREQGVKFDTMVRTAAERILSFPMSERTFAQAALTPKLGGLGLRKSIEHAGFAYTASWHESKRQAKENWIRPLQVHEAYVPQKEASFQFDEQMHKYLVDSAPDDREKQRLLRVAQPHAGGFVTATPSEEDGKDTLLRPRVFRTAMKYRLGVPVLSSEVPCPLCMQPINIYGDHATCCAKSGDLITRHNTLRNLVNKIASDGLLNPVMEKKGILGPTTGRRPGDVTIPNWGNGIGLAIDLAVTSPLIKSSVRLINPGEEYGASKKHRKYDVSFQGTDYSFCAMVFETLGAINDEGECVLKQLFRFAAKELGREFTSFCSRAWARVSCSLQRSVAQAILNRIDGNHSAHALLDLSGSNQLVEDPKGDLSVDASATIVHEAAKVTSSLDPQGGVSVTSRLPPSSAIVQEATKVALSLEAPVVWMAVPRPGCGFGTGELFCQCGDTDCSGTDRVRVVASASSSSTEPGVGHPCVEPPVVSPVGEPTPRGRLRSSPRVPPEIPSYSEFLRRKQERSVSVVSSGGGGSLVSSSSQNTSSVFIPINRQCGWSGRRGNINRPDNNMNISPLRDCTLDSPTSPIIHTSASYLRHIDNPEVLNLCTRTSEEKGGCGTQFPVGSAHSNKEL